MSASEKSILPYSTLAEINCRQLGGVGPQIAHYLTKCGVHTLQDLLFHFPLRYEDRTRITPINQLHHGSRALVKGIIQLDKNLPDRRRVFSCQLMDETGYLGLRFFHFASPYRQQFKSGTHLLCFGEVCTSQKRFFKWEMIHPDYHFLQPGQALVLSPYLTSVYPSTKGLSQKVWRKLIDQVFALLFLQEKRTLDPSPPHFSEYLPATLRQVMNLPHLLKALHYLHKPPRQASIETLLSRKHSTQQRVILEELLAHSLSLQQMRKKREQAYASPLKFHGSFHKRFLASLPFQLTMAQKRVINEIRQDMEKTYPMQRLLQGDVGSGKTIITAFAALQVVENNYQFVLMAPTELLCEQHYRLFCQWFEPLGLHTTRLTAQLKGKEKKTLLQTIKTGAAHIIIGTHALFQEQVEFNKLGLIVIDEQHRFGVQQRSALWGKGLQDKWKAHQLLMTATPIPRTLAMAAYTNLDISFLDEQPLGRIPVHTAVLSDKRRSVVIERVRHLCFQEKKQVYWVCPLIEESNLVQYQAAQTTFNKLQSSLPELRVGLIHGRLSTDEKQHIMSLFKKGDIDLLVATSIIEVGVDVSRASIIVIENAERLGLAQLHQLRGRVGRGYIQSYCVLLYQTLSPIAKKRLSIMRENKDGFAIAQHDLELRGPGEIFGTCQTGWQNLRIADLSRDYYLFPQVNKLSTLLTKEYPHLIEPIIKRWKKDDEHHWSKI